MENSNILKMNPKTKATIEDVMGTATYELYKRIETKKYSAKDAAEFSRLCNESLYSNNTFKGLSILGYFIPCNNLLNLYVVRLQHSIIEYYSVNKTSIRFIFGNNNVRYIFAINSNKS